MLGLWLVDPGRAALVLLVHQFRQASPPPEIPLTAPWLEAEAVRTGQPQWATLATLAQTFPLSAQIAQTEGLQALLSLPLPADQTIVGVLTLGWATPPPQPPAGPSLTALAALLGTTLQLARHCAALQQQVEDLLAARRRLELFLGAVAHDLRTPLTAILGYAQLLRRWPTLPPVQREAALARLLEAGQAMQRLLTDLLDAASLWAGRFRIAPRPMDLVTLVHQIAEEQQATTTRHQIVVEAPARLEGFWDPDRLAQVLRNLLSNAIKYSPEGGTIRLRVSAHDDSVQIQVSDQGIGLTPEEARQIFEPFVRLERARSIPGAGLGLFIARGIVEAHGGRIWAESPGPGRGTTVTVVLPRRPPPSEPQPAPAPAPSVTTGPPPSRRRAAGSPSAGAGRDTSPEPPRPVRRPAPASRGR